jgi:hypothetical protein
VLLVCLNRLLEASVRSQPTSVLGKTAGTVSLAPSTGQVLDWVRMLLDAHFARLTLLVRAPGGAALQVRFCVVKEWVEGLCCGALGLRR